MACGGSGCEGGRGVVVIAAAAADRAHRVVVGIDGEGVAVGREGGRVGGVAGNGYRARVVGVAVLPLHEVVARESRGRQGGRGTVVVAAASTDATHGGIGAAGGEGVTVDGEVGGEADVAGNGEGVGVGGGHLGAAFIPCGEVVARGGRGSSGEGGTILDDAVANRRNRTPSGIGAEGKAHCLEGFELHIVDGGRWVVSIRIIVIPHEDQIVVSRSGYLERVAGALPGVLSTEELPIG